MVWRLELLLRRHRLQPALIRLVSDPVLGQRLIAVHECHVFGIEPDAGEYL